MNISIDSLGSLVLKNCFESLKGIFINFDQVFSISLKLDIGLLQKGSSVLLYQYV